MTAKICSGNPELDQKISEYLDYARFLNKLDHISDVGRNHLTREIFSKTMHSSEKYSGLATAKEIEDMVLQSRYAELEKILMKRLAFGTAGMRGKMGPGYKSMNDLVIIQTSQGLASYIDSLYSDSAQRNRGIIIGYDNRYNSRRFAELAAVSFILKGIKVYLYSSIVPTPFVPFGVKKLKCLAGVMITASHNPKDENGYKVYWENGAQILSPIDKNIEASILKNLKPWPLSTRTSLVWTSPLCYDPLAEIDCMYYNEMKIGSLKDINANKEVPLKIAFTAMHGMSHSYMKKAFQNLQFDDYIAVEEQMKPDPDFPTVKFPNPEEGNCMDLSIATANKNRCQLILANDPDADRLAVAEKMENGKWHVFNGNQIGALLGLWLWKIYPEELKKDPSSCFMISSAVSSKILRSIAKKEGFQFYETLTGFKWMANKAIDLMKNGKNFVFAFEEAIGYMCGSQVMDKDGIQAAMRVTSMAAATYNEGKTLNRLLKEIYLKYGYHTSRNSYFLCYQEDKMRQMFSSLRGVFDDNVENCHYPDSLKSGDKVYDVIGIRDLTTGYDSLQPDKKAILPKSKSVQMITFYFSNGCELTLRASGTEPKLKFYAEMIVDAPEEEWENMDSVLYEMVDIMISSWIRPDEYGFIPRPT